MNKDIDLIIDKENEKCPVETALDVIDGKWKILILWYLRRDTKRFNELQKQMPKITQKMLSQKLKELELDGIINRVVYPEVPPKVEYSLSDYGKSLKPILKQLYFWGEKHKKNKEI
ncbi:winged helix-turn-helix transcriptional regulator [Malaciobacter marinus]|uniref:Transcriptional regulator n=1 Tax=Malaciobacter marinus TaxID=505249 RepID=A0A347TGW4_9BACT|nr:MULTISPECIES: helix-turn-helix domain-containing protein [Malaciobacter]AXX85842.1 transcriptional regulator, HxlR family [Malaciobacter marinus]PHO12846.1 transcriptional regulator [Malaciobacter marinus]PHO15032.1 transcriptional regulator [Malaciobacter marinus]RYA24356.1 transcriptional regulator [Malaciobacter halophilus]